MAFIELPQRKKLFLNCKRKFIHKLALTSEMIYDVLTNDCFSNRRLICKTGRIFHLRILAVTSSNNARHISSR